MPSPLLKFAAALCGLSLASDVAAADLTVEVRGLANERGTVNVALFDKAENFTKTALVGESAPATLKPAVLVFRNVAPGSYALAAFHDANSNGKLDTNMLGLPTEKYGFSRDAMGAFGPPRFDAAKITVGKDNLSIIINLR